MITMLGAGDQMKRTSLSFRSVNLRGCQGYDPDLQRHHLLPRQLLTRHCFATLIATLGRDRIGFDDFRRNGILLPSQEKAALRTLLPMHRGPHRAYNDMVMERVGCIEAHWVVQSRQSRRQACEDALQRLSLLQRALRRRLFERSRRTVLNRRDPALARQDFDQLDAMAELLWAATS